MNSNKPGRKRNYSIFYDPVGIRALDTRERGSHCKTQTTKENATIRYFVIQRMHGTCYFVIRWINKWAILVPMK
jgi:hypothetical protein